MDGMLTFTARRTTRPPLSGSFSRRTRAAERSPATGSSTLGGIIADHPFAVIFSLLMLIGVAGTAGYAVRLQTEDDVEDAVLVAELDDKLSRPAQVVFCRVRCLNGVVDVGRGVYSSPRFFIH